MSDGSARERISTLLFFGTMLLLIYLLHLLFRPFLAPLTWAAILAALFFAPYKRLRSRWGKTLAASASTAAVTILIIVPVLFVMTAFVQEATLAVSSVNLSVQTEGFARLERIWVGAQEQLGGTLPDLRDVVRQGAAWIAGLAAGQAGALLRNIIAVIVNLVVTLFAVFFFFRDGDAIMAVLRRALPFEAEQSERMIGQARDLIHASVTAGLTVAVIQGALGGITFWLLGIGAAVFWGVVMAFFALLPVGAGIVWAPAAAWLLISGSVGHGVVLLVVGFSVIGLVDNVLRPALLSGRSQLNGLLVFVSLVGGISAFGFLGLVLGPVIMAMAVGMLDAYTKDGRIAPSKIIA